MIDDISLWVVEYAQAEAAYGGLLHGRYNAGCTIIPYSFGVVRTGNRIVLIDCGFSSRTSGVVYRDAAGVVRHSPATALLQQIGVAPDEVDAVIVTHLHFDHCGNVDLFPNASVYLQSTEYEAAVSARTMTKRLRWLNTAVDPDDLHALERVRDRGRLILLEGDDTVFPGIRIIAAHDTHTAGSQYVVLDTTDGRWAIAGDVVYLWDNFTAPERPGEFVPIGHIEGSTTRTLFCMAEILETVGGELHRIVPFHERRLFDVYPTVGLEGGQVAELLLSNRHQSLVN